MNAITGACVAPTNDGSLCGESSTTERVLAEVICRLCDDCARQIDLELLSDEQIAAINKEGEDDGVAAVLESIQEQIRELGDSDKAAVEVSGWKSQGWLDAALNAGAHGMAVSLRDLRGNLAAEGLYYAGYSNGIGMALESLS